jgi:cytochrome c biogenesis protein CcdA
MAFASLSASITQAILMLFLFALGQGLILILAGFLTSHLKQWKGFYQFSDWLLKISGILLILAALYIYYKIFNPFL